MEITVHFLGMSLRGRSLKQSPPSTLETASPSARSDMRDKVNSYKWRMSSLPTSQSSILPSFMDKENPPGKLADGRRSDY
jgi:hypothetical protein